MQLKALPREIFGKKTNSLRKEGLLPAEIYGHNKENKHITVSSKEFANIYKEAGEHTVINILLEKDSLPTMIVGVQTDPIKGSFISADFHQIRMDEKIQTHIPIEFEGEAPGTKQGLLLVKVLSELEVEALPNDLPHSIQISLEHLINDKDTIHVKDLKLGRKIKILVPPETVITTLTEHKEEEVVAPPEPVSEEEKRKEAIKPIVEAERSEDAK